MTDSHRADRYICIDIEVNRAHEGQAIILGGKLQDNSSWKQRLTKRAGHLLWSRLTKLLFPEKAQKVTAIVSTVPLNQLSLDPEVTTHIDVEYTADDYYQLMGVTGQEKWQAHLNSQLVRRLWTALDMALYPDGWEVNDSHQRRSRRQTFQ